MLQVYRLARMVAARDTAVMITERPEQGRSWWRRQFMS
jgi:hypothetical protein